MTLSLDPQTEARLRGLAEREHLSVEHYVARLLDQADRREELGAPSQAKVVQKGRFRVISGALPPGYDIVKAIDDIREEHSRQVLGL